MNSKLLIKTILLFLMVSTSFMGFNQSLSSRNGANLSVNGETRVLVIFVQVDYDVNPQFDPTNPDRTAIWPINGLPNWKDQLFDTGAISNYTGEVTKYFNDASFGSYKVHGDYIDSIFTIPDSVLSGNLHEQADDIRSNLASQLNGFTFQTRNNMTYSKFDLWQNNITEGAEKVASPDNSLDHVMILMRNFHLYGGSAGRASTGSLAGSGNWVSDTYSQFNAAEGIPTGIVTHEYGHLLYGGNQFHCVGRGASNSTDGWTFMHPTGGYSGLGSSGYLGISVNAWDRHRLGWIPSGKTHAIRANQIVVSPPYEFLQEVNSDIEEENDLTNDGTYLLKDFIQTGDALRIKLPYLKSGTGSNVRDQWLWIENRQGIASSVIDLDTGNAKGIYAYIQVGKEDTSSFSGNANYLHFLPAIGSYDLKFTNVDTLSGQGVIDMITERNNPFTGYHHLMQSPYDIKGDGVLNRTSIAQDVPPDIVYPAGLKRNGVVQTAVVNPSHIVLGTDFDAFTDENGWRKIGIGYNPAAVPVYSYQTKSELPATNPRPYDNRTIHLNGISVEVLEVRQNGDVKVKVRFDDYDVVNDLRWCGNIVLHEQVNIKPEYTVTIDQGYMPQRPKNPVTMNNQQVFADKSKFTMNAGSFFTLENNSNLIIQGGSEFHMEGGQFAINDSAEVILKDSCKFYIKDTSNLLIKPGGKFTIEEGAELIVENDDQNLLVGSFRNPGNPPTTVFPAELIVKGTLKFDNMDWEVQNRDGFYHFYSTHSLNIDSGFNVNIDGINPETKILQLEINTTLNLEGSDVTISDGIIKMAYNAQILTKHGDVDMEDISLDNGTIMADSVNSFDALRFDVVNCETAFNISNVDATAGNIKIHYTDFASTVDNAIVGTNLEELQVNEVTSEAYNSTIRADNCRIVRFKGAVSNNSGAAIDLNDIEGCYLTSTGTDITYCDTAVKAINSLVFLRNGAIIANNHVGIYGNGGYDEISQAFKTMISVGDVGCGEIIHHSTSFGDRPISGRDILLNIDAELHAAVGGNGENINPNSFYDNNIFEICYGQDSLNPDTIPAKSNYWNSSTYSVLKQLYSCNGFNYCNGAKCYAILLDTTNESSCYPTGSGCSTCGMRDKTGISTTDGIIFTNFGEAYEQFVLEDSYTTRTDFNSLASLELIKDSLGENGPEWLSIEVEPGQDTVPISSESAHLIMVAKAIYHARTVPPGAKLKKEIWTPLFQDYLRRKELQVRLTPNPTNGIVLIEKVYDDPFTYFVNVYNARGQVLTQDLKLQSNLKLDLSNFNEKGLYFIEVFSKKENIRVVVKVVYQ